MANMNGYELTNNWFSFIAEKTKPVDTKHTAMYLYIVELFNKMGWAETIGLPTDFTMQMLNMGSYKTYSATLKDLVDFGFINIIQQAKNQFISTKIALVKNDKAKPKHLPKQVESNDQSTSTINKLLNLETIKLINDNAALIEENLLIWIENHNENAGKFKKPTIQEIKQHLIESTTWFEQTCDREANKFFAYYESNGWKVGKNKMQKWKQAASGWATRSGISEDRNKVEPQKYVATFKTSMEDWIEYGITDEEINKIETKLIEHKLKHKVAYDPTNISHRPQFGYQSRLIKYGL